MKLLSIWEFMRRGKEVFETKGYTVGFIFMRKWVNKVAKLSGERVDFHKSGGGTWVVKTLGNISKVKKAIKELKQEYDYIEKYNLAIAKKESLAEKFLEVLKEERELRGLLKKNNKEKKILRKKISTLDKFISSQKKKK